jgi:sulfur carrier protein
MTVLVNENPREVPEASLLAHLLREMGVEAKRGVAVALNGKVVPSVQWQETKLTSNDEVLLIQATQGG